MNHPCRYWQCVENIGGQCFGMGCSTNPMPAPSEPDTEDEESESDN